MNNYSLLEYFIKLIIFNFIFFNFIFEENLKVIDGKIGNTKYTLPYRVMGGKTSPSGGLVELGGIEPPTSCVPRKRSPS